MSTVEKFGARLLEAWRKATLERVVIHTPDRSTAERLRFRLYSLRRALESDAHELYPLAARVSISISPSTNEQWLLIMELADSDFDNLLERAGITTAELELPEDFPDLSTVSSDS